MTEIKLNLSDKMFSNDIYDKFQDFFNRVIADISDSLNNDNVCMCGRYELETAVLLRSAFRLSVYNEEEAEIDEP